jgi:hypothetical protein
MGAELLEHVWNAFSMKLKLNTSMPFFCYEKE